MIIPVIKPVAKEVKVGDQNLIGPLIIPIWLKIILGDLGSTSLTPVSPKKGGYFVMMEDYFSGYEDSAGSISPLISMIKQPELEAVKNIPTPFWTCPSEETHLQGAM